MLHNTTMRPPSKKEASGYDIMVWVDHEGSIVTRAFTKQGHSALRAFVNQYTDGDIVEIYISPSDFEAELPPDVSVGMLTGKGVRGMRSAALH